MLVPHSPLRFLTLACSAFFAAVNSVEIHFVSGIAFEAGSVMGVASEIRRYGILYFVTATYLVMASTRFYGMPNLLGAIRIVNVGAFLSFARHPRIGAGLCLASSGSSVAMGVLPNFHFLSLARVGVSPPVFCDADYARKALVEIGHEMPNSDRLGAISFSLLLPNSTWSTSLTSRLIDFIVVTHLALGGYEWFRIVRHGQGWVF